MSEEKRVTIPFIKSILKPVVDLIHTKANKKDVYAKTELADVAVSGSYNDLSDVPAPDTTLSVEGAAADAKAVGNALINSVLHIEQDLTEDQQKQTRANIGLENFEDDAVIDLMLELDIIPVILDDSNSIMTTDNNDIIFVN